MRTDELNTNHIIADEGKVFQRISDGIIFGREIFLGYTFRIGEELLAEARLEQPEDFEEIDSSTETILLEDNTSLVDDTSNIIALSCEPMKTTFEESEKRTITISDYQELERKVNYLMKMIEEK